MQVEKLYSMDLRLADIRYFHAVVTEATPQQVTALGLDFNVAIQLAFRLDEVLRDTNGVDGLKEGSLDLSANAFEVLVNLIAQRSKERDAVWGQSYETVKPLLQMAADERLKGFVLDDMIESLLTGQGALAEALKSIRSRGNARNN